MRRIAQIGGRIVAATLVLWLGTSTRLGASTTFHFDDLGPSCSPAIPAGYQGFDCSSSTYELDPTYAYLVDLSVSDVSNDNNTVPHLLINGLTLNVWPVRGGSK